MAKRPWSEPALAGPSLIGALACFCLPVSNPDLFWHLSAGRWMVERRALPRADWLSWSMPGKPWADFEWGTQLLWQAAHAVAGLAGLWVLKVAFLCAAAFLLWRALEASRVGWAGRGLGVLAFSLALLPADDVRPENISIVFFIGLWSALERRRVKGGGPGLWALAGLFALWANLHAGFVYGLVLLFIYAAVEAGKRRSWALAKGLGVGALAVLLNPYGTDAYLVPLEHWRSLGDLSRYIKEWRGAAPSDSWLLPFWGLFLCSAGTALARWMKRKDLPVEHSAALAFFGLSAARHARTIPYLACLAVPILVQSFSRLKLVAGEKRAAFFTALAACWGFFLWKVPPALAARTFSPTYVPVGLADFLDAQRPMLGRLRLYNPWHWGGYLGWRLFPDYPVYVDGRYLFHPLLREVDEARKSPQTYADLLAKEGIELALIERTDQFVETPAQLKGGRREILSRPIYLFYLPRERWALARWDAQGAIFVRRSAVSAAWLAEHEYRYLRPGDFPAAALKVRTGLARRGDVEKEAARLVAESPAQAEAVRAWLEELK